MEGDSPGESASVETTFPIVRSRLGCFGFESLGTFANVLVLVSLCFEFAGSQSGKSWHPADWLLLVIYSGYGLHCVSSKRT